MSGTETQKERKQRIDKIPANALCDTVDTDTEFYRSCIVDSRTSTNIACNFGMLDTITLRWARLLLSNHPHQG